MAFLAVILISTAGNMVFVGSASALTSQSTTGFQFSFNPSLSISLSSADLVIPHLTPGNYASSNTITVNVSTNNSYGYTLIAKVGEKNNPNLANNNLVNTTANTTTGNSDVFTSLSTSDKLTIANFDDNKWGYTVASSIDNTTTYSGLLYNADTIINATKTSTGIPMSNTYPGTNNTSFTIAAKAGNTLSSGEYTNIINFRGVANINTDVTINDLRYMQDIADLTDVEKQIVLSSMTTGTTYQLRDIRDDKIYNIAKLKDGNIWLQDNLALDPATLKSGVTLDSTNTNLPAGTTFTLPSSTSVGFDENAYSFTAAAINTDFKNMDIVLGAGQSGTGKVGVFYNYCAASAGTYCVGPGSGSSDGVYDICPKGWRLPTGGAGGEFQTLRNQYSSDGEYVLALRTPLSGYYVDSSIGVQGEYGVFWSSTRYDGIDMRRLIVTVIGVDALNGTGGRGYGFSVRCVKK